MKEIIEEYGGMIALVLAGLGATSGLLAIINMICNL